MTLNRGSVFHERRRKQDEPKGGRAQTLFRQQNWPWLFKGTGDPKCKKEKSLKIFILAILFTYEGCSKSNYTHCSFSATVSAIISPLADVVH